MGIQKFPDQIYIEDGEPTHIIPIDSPTAQQTKSKSAVKYKVKLHI